MAKRAMSGIVSRESGGIVIGVLVRKRTTEAMGCAEHKVT